VVIEIPVGLTLAAANNSFSVNFWNKNIAGDHHWTADDQNKIMNRIPDSGFRITGSLAAPLIGVAANRFGLNIGAEAAGFASAPKDLMRLALLGNQLNKSYQITDFSGESYTLLNYGLGFGYRFDQEKLPGLFFGAGFHFYQGLAMAKVAQADGDLLISDSLISGYSILHAVESTQGDGVGFDLSGLASLSDKWDVGLSIRQIAARLSWQVNENQLVTFYTDSGGVIIDSLKNDGYLERVFHQTDTSYSGGSIETKLPILLQANGKYRFHRKLSFLAETLIRTQQSAQGKAGIELGVATEYTPNSWFLLQGGFGVGGPYRTRFGLGGGLHFNHYELELGWNWSGGLFNSAHGIAVGLSQRLKF
jgi:hypothetical protein